MKKYRILIILLAILLIPSIVYARSDTITVTLKKCIDGDTATFDYNNEDYKVRFLAVNTMELKSNNKYATIALDFTCDELKNAKEIKLEFDKGSDELDKYNRYLAWVFVDDVLLQEKLVEKGYAEIKYIYGDYKYTDYLKEKEKIAKDKKIGIWSDYNNEKNESKSYKDYLDYIYAILLVIFILLGLSTTKLKKIRKALNQIK